MGSHEEFDTKSGVSELRPTSQLHMETDYHLPSNELLTRRQRATGKQDESFWYHN